MLGGPDKEAQLILDSLDSKSIILSLMPYRLVCLSIFLAGTCFCASLLVFYKGRHFASFGDSREPRN